MATRITIATDCKNPELAAACFSELIGPDGIVQDKLEATKIGIRAIELAEKKVDWDAVDAELGIANQTNRGE